MLIPFNVTNIYGKCPRTQPYTKNYMQLRNSENGRINFLQVRAHQLVVQYQNGQP